MELAHTGGGTGVHFEMLLVGVALVVLGIGAWRDKAQKRYIGPLFGVVGIGFVVASLVI